jgi:hypothetical protein
MMLTIGIDNNVDNTTIAKDDGYDNNDREDDKNDEHDYEEWQVKKKRERIGIDLVALQGFNQTAPPPF